MLTAGPAGTGAAEGAALGVVAVAAAVVAAGAASGLEQAAARIASETVKVRMPPGTRRGWGRQPQRRAGPRRTIRGKPGLALLLDIVYPARMQDVDVGSIVPSTRDLLQAVTTRRRNLALLGLIGGERAAEEALRLSELNVSAFAAAEPGPALTLAARATKTVPSLCLGAAGDRQALLAARQYGADGVVVDARLPLDEWDRLAKTARTMRMLPLALAVDAPSLEAAGKAGARAILLQAGSAAELIELAARAPRAGVTLVGYVQDGGPDAVRALAGKLDAAVVPPSVHAAAGFAELVAEVDP
jgi:hypothetical protein